MVEEAWTRIQRMSFALMAAMAAGCGGGGGGTEAGPQTPTDPSPPVSPSPGPTPAASTAGAAEGLWKEVKNGERIRYVLVEPDGQLWGIPQTDTFLPDAQSGEAIKGSVSASSGTVSGTFSEVALGGCIGAEACLVTGLSTSSDLALNGVFKDRGFTLPRWSFSGVPDARYRTAASLAEFAGTWNVGAYIPGNMFAGGAVTITSTGAISASNVSGCAFEGSLRAVNGTGYFKVSLSSVSGTCASGVTPAQVTGVAFLAGVQNRAAPVINIMWHGADPTRHFWSSGTK